MLITNPSNHSGSTSIINLITLCKALKHLHQVHAHFVISGHSQNDAVLTKILHTITNISPFSTTPVSHSNPFLSYAVSVFNSITNQSTFCFNTIVRAHILHSSPLTALSFFVQMYRRSVPPDFHTFPFALKACSLIRGLSLAQTLHCQALRLGFITELFVLNSLTRCYCVTDCLNAAHQVFAEGSHRDVITYNVLIDGFVKNGDVSRARELFASMPVRDSVSWNSLIAGYAQMKQCKEAIELFNEMIALDLKPDNVALVSALSACAQLGGLEQGKAIHDYIERNRTYIDAFLATGLVDFYAKCGYIDTAMEVFELSSEKSLFTWNAMLVGLAMHGHGRLTLKYFHKMVDSGVKPDGISFLGVFVACSHAGLVHEAKKLFSQMESLYGVARELKHYGCMADLLSRAGLIQEAMEMIKKLPDGGDVSVWSGLLGGCRIHGNVEVAERAAGYVMELKPEDGGVHKVMADVYANLERWDDVVKIRRFVDGNRGVKKNAGCSLIELNGLTHEFVAGDDLHSRTGEIYWVLTRMREHQLEAC